MKAKTIIANYLSLAVCAAAVALSNACMEDVAVRLVKDVFSDATGEDMTDEKAEKVVAKLVDMANEDYTVFDEPETDEFVDA